MECREDGWGGREEEEGRQGARGANFTRFWDLRGTLCEGGGGGRRGTVG